MLSAQNISRPRPGAKPHVSPEGIIYCTDGKFRWVYEIDQRKRPTTLLSLLWKCIAAGILVGILPLLLKMLPTPDCVLFLAGAVVVGILIALGNYGADLLRNGPMLCLLFTADETSVSCQQVKGKNTKESVSGAIAAWVGGQSQPALRFHEETKVSFHSVSTIRANSARELIRIDGLSVRAEAAQFPLVLSYLRRQCPNADVQEV